MTHTRKLASVLLSVFLSITHLSSNAQDQVTGNLINFTGTPTDTTSNWNNGVYVKSLTCWQPGGPGNCGPYPNVQTNGSINFSYGQVDLNQVVNINKALEAGGSGVQLSGFNFSFTAKNGNGWDNGQQDYLSAYVKFYDASKHLAASYDYTSQTNRKYNWTNFNFTETFTNPIAATNYSNAQVGFIGRDTNGWAGPYGPEINNVKFSLKYRTDPCATNPAFGPQCAGFSDLLTSINLVPYPNAVATASRSVDNSYPIATVLSSSGSGLTLHGFKYGFVYELKDPYCSSTFLGIFCTGTTDSVARVSAGASNASGGLVFNNLHTFQGANTGPQEMNYQYLFPASTNTNLMGTFHFGASVEGNGSVYNMYSKMIVTPDPCIKNVMYSSSCTGFQEAIDKLAGTNKTDYATTGYTEPASVTSGTSSSEALTFTSAPNGSTVAVTPVPPPVASPTSGGSNPSSNPASVASMASGSTSDKSSSGSPVNLSFAMNLISKNAEKEKSIAMSAVATAVEQAQAAGTQAQQDAVSIATKASEASTSTSFGGTSSSSSSTTTSESRSASSGGGLMIQGAGVGAIQLQGSGPSQSSVSIASSTTQITQQSFTVEANYSIVPMMQVASIAPTLNGPTFSEMIQSTQSSQSISIDRTYVEVEAPSNSTGFITDRNNPLREIIDAQPIIAGVSMEQQMSTVKKNVAINEAAAGVDIGKMAIAPMGYNTYLTLAIKDASFYAPRDIYPRQTNVDNARALRQMSSDRLHQEMINQQYQGR